MLLGRSLEFQTPEASEAALSRLSSVTIEPQSIAPMHPVPVSAWVAQHVGKRFVGKVGGSRFKLGLMPQVGERIYVRGSVVVIVGEVQGHTVNAKLRLPVFVSAFLALYSIAVAAVLLLSFFGPSNGPVVHLLLAAALVLPTAIVFMFFRKEAALAEQRLRQVLGCS